MYRSTGRRQRFGPGLAPSAVHDGSHRPAGFAADGRTDATSRLPATRHHNSSSFTSIGTSLISTVPAFVCGGHAFNHILSPSPNIARLGRLPD